MGTSTKKNNMGGILVLLVFAVFAVSILMILLSGADIVQKLSLRDQRSYDYRTAVQYVSTRVHQADSAGMVSAGKMGDGDALVLTEEIDGYLYNTIIYCHEGYLRELFCEAGLDIQPEFGEEILPIREFRVFESDGFLQMEMIMADGGEEELLLQLRSGRGSI